MTDNIVKFKKRTPEKRQQQRTPGQKPPQGTPRQLPVWLKQVLVFVFLFAALGVSYAYFSFTAP